MKINSVRFVRGYVNPKEVAAETLPQYAFIGRSNVGKSSLINMLTKTKSLAKTSSSPGHTQEINFFLINEKFYLVDLPGYGYARVSAERRETIYRLIEGYLFGNYANLVKVVVIIDGLVGPTADDLDIIAELDRIGRCVVVAVNKIDKIKKSGLKKQLDKIQELVGDHVIVPMSVAKKVGVGNLIQEVFQDTL